MKRTLIKSICLTLLWCGIAQLASAQGIVINKKDGTRVYYKSSEVQSVGVYGYGEGPIDSLDEQAYVDLGLPSGTLWATMNIGAKDPEEYGDYFAWGETTGYNGGKESFSWSNYKYCNGSEKTLWKYCDNKSYGTVDNKTELEPVDDAATAIWGEAWKMPSYDQYNELINSNYTDIERATLNGITGIKITSKRNMKSIFFPAAGVRWATLEHADEYLFYWSCSKAPGGNSAWYFGWQTKINFGMWTLGRYCGFPIRPVRVQK